MRKSDNTSKCDPQNFRCICQASHSLANNTQFDQQCVMDGCTGDLGKEEFLDYLIYQCRQVNHNLTDIPKQWEPYLPVSFPKPSATSSTASSTASSAAFLPLSHAPSRQLSDGAKAGIGIGVLAVLAILAALGVTFYRAKMKVKEVQKRNAELVDRQSAHGVSAYIRKTIGKSTASLPVTEGGTTLVGEAYSKGRSLSSGYPPGPWARGPGGLQRLHSESEYGDELQKEAHIG